MPTFDFLTLLWWGLPLVAAPVVIHLINLLRYKQVRFAALELLLASQQKYRTQVRLRQLLLLALRTLAVAGIVLACAQPRWRPAVGSLFGGGGVQLVLLDDSVSMGDRAGGGRDRDAGSCFGRGRRAAERIATDAAARGDAFAFAAFSQLDLDATNVGGRDALERAAVGWLATPPRGPLDHGLSLLGGDRAAGTLWLVSDFRLREWQDEEAAAAVRRLADAGVAIRLVDCGVDPETDASGSPAAASNLSVTRLEPVGGVPAAGVLLPLEIDVRNDGPQTVRDVQIELLEDGSPRPGLHLAEIPPGGTATRRFEVRFTTAGGHEVEARLPADRLPADDIRSCVVDIFQQVDVLIVAGGAEPGSDAFYVATALAPGAAAATGLRPRVVPPDALGAIDLSAFDCIWVMDLPQLHPDAIAALEAHAAAGGGVVFFCGPSTRADEVNRTLHRDGEGIFPLPLAGSVEVLRPPGPGRVPDIVAEPHPVVAVLSGSRNPLLDAVRIERVMAVERGFDEGGRAGVRRLVSLQDGRPLVVERRFGKGLVAAVLTTAAPLWNNWARGNPSWVVVMLELQGHLAGQRRRLDSLEVGADVAVRLMPGRDEIEVDFLVPPDGAVVRQVAAPAPATSPGTGPAGGFEARLRTSVPGVYAARWRRADGIEQERLVAVAIDADEGRLERVGRDRLARQLAGVPFRFDAAEDLDPGGSLAGLPLARPLLFGLLGILVLEQLVAFAASYHPTAGRPRG